MKRRHGMLAWLLAIACLASALAQVPSPSATESQETAAAQIKAQTWARENHRAVLDLVFQESCPLDKTESKDMRWQVCVRILPGFAEEPEYELSLERGYDGSVLARVARPRAQSVYTQLWKLRMEHPDASPASLAKLIVLDSETGDQKKSPALGRLAHDFEKIRIAPTLSDELMPDETEYEFLVNAYWGEHLDLVIFGPGSDAPYQHRPLLRWAEDLRKLLEGWLDQQNHS